MAHSLERLSKKVEYSVLFSFYGALLTENQQQLVHLYCDEDLSLGEIGRQLSITRQGVGDTINRAFIKLDQYEQVMGLARRLQTIRENLRLCTTHLEKVVPTKATADDLQQAMSILQKLREEEE